MIKSRIVGWAEHVARMGRGKVRTEFWWENLMGRNHFIDQEDDIKIVFKERDWEAWTRLIWLRIGPGVGFL